MKGVSPKHWHNDGESSVPTFVEFVTNFFGLTKTTDLPSYQFGAVDRADVAFCRRIAALRSYGCGLLNHYPGLFDVSTQALPVAGEDAVGFLQRLLRPDVV